MDELIIGDKKYISSKQAAKATGYAKDYVGQLCREGRVPARLVGRSWYVLESAIQDHRFSERKDEAVRSASVGPSSPSLQSIGEAPRYEASETEVLPSINHLRDNEPPGPADEKNDDGEVAKRLQETWQAWFDRFDHVAGAGVSGSTTGAPSADSLTAEKGSESGRAKPEMEENDVVNIPIHAVYQSPPEELLPRAGTRGSRMEAVFPSQQSPQRGRKGKGRILILTVQTMGIACALFIAATAVLGSGYFDEYIISSNQARIIAGVSLYNK